MLNYGLCLEVLSGTAVHVHSLVYWGRRWCERISVNELTAGKESSKVALRNGGGQLPQGVYSLLKQVVESDSLTPCQDRSRGQDKCLGADLGYLW